jgi:SAM-dependent methyltransferase
MLGAAIRAITGRIGPLVKGLLRPTVLRWRARRRRLASPNSALDNRAVFTDIYQRRQWGGPEGEFYSGHGSENAYADAYVEAVRSFIARWGIRDVVDIGCGDFRIGSRIQAGVNYVGVDVVPALIEAHRARHGAPNVTFVCLDATTDALPPGELCLIRQVLQHLSNDEIKRVLRAASSYKFVVVTEHYPPPGRLVVPNLDKAHGADIRMSSDSAVCLDRPPFNRLVGETLCEVVVESDGSILRTIVLDQRAVH